MRYLLGFICVLALGVMGCGQSLGPVGGGGGDGGGCGNGGDGGVGGNGGGLGECSFTNRTLLVETPGNEPCVAGTDRSEPCTVAATGAAGFRVCRGWEIVADVREHYWDVCLEACAVDENGSERTCEAGGAAGFQYCDRIAPLSEDRLVWFPCMRPECLECRPGETERCGPDLPYPDSLKVCALQQGWPVFFDGNCYT